VGTNTDPPGGSHNVSQGGPQDISQFRSIVNAGQVPSPDTLDPVGFFAEHALDIPSEDCGKDVCVHPSLAVAPRFDGGNWTMAFVSMSTPVDPDKLPHPPVHLAVVVEESTFTGLDDGSFQTGMAQLLGGLTASDRVSLISFDGQAQRTALAEEPTSQTLQQQIQDLPLVNGGDQVALYDGIAEAQKAFDDADAKGFKGEHRVLLITSGHATAGITDPEHVVALGEGMALDGAAFSVIGVGPKFDQEIPVALGSMGAGTYSYALGGGDLSEVLKEEGQTALYPLARDLVLKVLPAKGYKVGRIYGVRRAVADASGATLGMPAIFIGKRQGSASVGGSRRGGGGGLFVELIADATAAGGVLANAPAFQVTADWDKALDGSKESIQTTLNNTLAPGKNPDQMWWTLSDNGSGKEYMMLNMYLALRGSLDFYQAGDCARAMGVVDMMQTSVSAWLGKYPDTDISDDNNLMQHLRQNIQNACQAAATSVTPIEPTSFGGGCCFI
jgi:Ca-activated chloride channel family protein